MAQVNQEERAFRAWQVLAGVAMEGEKITYGDLAKRLDVHHRTTRYFLELIQSYCMNAKLPPLTILVVGKSGRPGRGFIAWDIDNLDEGFRRVYGYNWTALENPFAYAAEGFTVRGLAKALLESEPEPAVVYTRVKVRGIVQEIFRAALLQAYSGRCAVCAFPFEVGLDAAHIRPWADSNHAERLDVRNGVLLCKNHHALFDAGILRIEEDFTLSFNGPHEAWLGDPVSSTKPAAKLALPRNRELRPSVDYLRRRREMAHG